MIPLSMWTIYERPADYPRFFVARRYEVTAGQSVPTDDVLLADSLQDLRDLLPYGLFQMTRFEEDDPAIVEVWL